MLRLDPINTGGPAWLIRRPDGDVLHVPARVVGHVDDGSLPYDLTFVAVADESAHGVPVCEELTLRRRPGGPPIRPSTVTGLGLGSFLTEAAMRASTRYTTTFNDEGKLVLSLSSETDHQPDETDKRHLTPRKARNRRANAAGGSKYEEARKLYEYFKSQGNRDPFQWVAEQLGVSRATAARYVQRAKRENDQ